MFEVPQISKPDDNEFPNGPTVRGRYYISPSPCSDEQIVIMSYDTWADFGTQLESLKQVAAAQDKRIKELLAQVAAAGLRMEDAEKRLNNLRTVRRNEMRADMESKVYVPPGNIKRN